MCTSYAAGHLNFPGIEYLSIYLFRYPSSHFPQAVWGFLFLAILAATSFRNKCSDLKVMTTFAFAREQQVTNLKILSHRSQVLEQICLFVFVQRPLFIVAVAFCQSLIGKLDGGSLQQRAFEKFHLYQASFCPLYLTTRLHFNNFNSEEEPLLLHPRLRDSLTLSPFHCTCLQ